jgi:flagellum-specific ATP synthase
MQDWTALAKKIETVEPVSAYGLVSGITGLLIEANGPRVSVGK